MPIWLHVVMALALCWCLCASPSRSQRMASSFNGAAEEEAEAEPLSCEDARLRCAYRTGCGRALQGYLVGCADLMSGRDTRCPHPCQRALIALTSTEEGHQLMKCDCAGDAFCLDSKRRVEVCRPEVTRLTHNASGVSCGVAHVICAADPLCSTALEYYRRFCRAMFQGKRCTHRCNNSIEILRRQEKAARLGSCVCDGSEDFDCQQVRRNMDALCFRTTHHQQTPEETNEVDHARDRDQGRAGHRPGKGRASGTTDPSWIRTLLLLALMLLLRT